MAQDTLLGFPAHTLPYRRGKFITLSTASRKQPVRMGRLLASFCGCVRLLRGQDFFSRPSRPVSFSPLSRVPAAESIRAASARVTAVSRRSLPKLPTLRTFSASMFPTACAAQEGTASRSANHTSNSTSPRSSTRFSTVAASLKEIGSSQENSRCWSCHSCRGPAYGL